MNKLGTINVVPYIIYFYQKLLQLSSRAVLYCTLEARFTTTPNGESSNGSWQQSQFWYSLLFTVILGS
ncbi:hypothetical protein [Nostoc sp.]|uniref:hypothetical protein n=1 Tax=Nostoc sp. TaxID=1180 RepID=UPI002FF44DED